MTSKVSGILALLYLAFCLQAAHAGTAISAAIAKQIGCAAIQARYPNGDYKCTALSVVLAALGGDWTGNRIIRKPIPRTRNLGGTPYAIVSSKTGQVLKVGHAAM